MGKREARPGIARPVIVAEQFCMTDQENMNLIKRLNGYLKKSKFNQHAVADGIGRSAAYISNILSGKSNLSLKDFVFLCRLFGVNPGDVLNEVLRGEEQAEDNSLRRKVDEFTKTELEEFTESLTKLQNILNESEKRKK